MLQGGLVLSFGRWGIKGLVLVAALALLVALLAACKSDSKGGKTPTSDVTPEATDTPDNGGDGDGDGGGGDGGLQDLERLASEAAGDFTGKITYGITTEAGGQKTEQGGTLAQRHTDSRFVH